MANIKLSLALLTQAQKRLLGRKILSRSSGNPDAPGNEAMVAALTAKQAAYEGAIAAAHEARSLAQ